MSLRKKIIFSFFISAFIIAVLAVFEYVNYHQVRDEMRFLEITDTIRSKSLQLRRHEKNFFLYAAKAEEELRAIYDYLDQLADVTRDIRSKGNGSGLQTAVRQYRDRFDHIIELHYLIETAFARLSPRLGLHKQVLPLIEANFLDRPAHVADFLESALSPKDAKDIVTNLRELDREIAALRKTGEDIITLSKDLDTAARAKAERGIHISQIAILIVFPLFLVIGLGALFYISNDVVKRLHALSSAVEKTGERFMPSVPAPQRPWNHSDEVGVLIEKYLRMDKQLELWAEELYEKNRELMESKKLAAIGTLASGVAHELNNPLNNIFLSVQVLQRQFGGDIPEAIRETIEDISGQTVRVKGIVSDLLEFAREKEPHLEELELTSLIARSYDMVRRAMNVQGIRFSLDLPPHPVMVRMDPGMMERVFVNLFSNAIAAMEGGGTLVVKVQQAKDAVTVWVSDTGKGMSEEDMEKVFDPFFTKKDKGTGLGLAIVMNIIKKHHGTISVASVEDEGTAFEIILPVETAAAKGA